MKQLDAKLLFVEDDVITLNIMQELLKNFFSEVITAKNGKQGLEIFKNGDIDLVFTDVNMPKMNGIEMIKEIRKVNKDIPIVIFSAYNENDDYNFNSIELSICEHMIKPLNIDALQKLIEKCEKKLKEKKCL